MAAQHTHGPNYGRHVDGCPRCDELAAGAEPISDSNRARRDDTPKTTDHNHGPNFGRKVDGCPRCEELKAGAEPVRWAPSRREQDELRAQEIRDHDCVKSGCSIVCTFGQW
jgi:hypothetical protein